MPNWAPEMGMLLGHWQGWVCQPVQSPGLGNAGEVTEDALVWKVLWVVLFCFVFNGF